MEVMILGLLAVLPNASEPNSRQELPDECLAPAVRANAGARGCAASANFEVTSHSLNAGAVAERCEQLRIQLHKTWNGDNLPCTWSPRCKIIVHATRASYCSSVGRGSASTVGSSWIGRDAGQIAVRRIDLLAGKQGLPSLEHELTHLVLADLFGGRRPPLWADEGIAMLSDDLAKRRLHQRDMQRARAHRASPSLANLFSRESYPAESAFPAFYGQSVSVTAWLVARGTPSQFVRFVNTAQELGYDRALWNEYSIAGVAELEQLWIADGQSNVRLDVGIRADP